MHGSNRLGGNSLSDLLVFGRRAGRYAAQYALTVPPGVRSVVDRAQLDAVAAQALAPFDTAVGSDSARPPENPYQLQSDLQEVMQRLVGIIRTEPELVRALREIEALRIRAGRVTVVGHRQYNPGWHLALDLRSLLTVAECIATAALARRESRGGHTRDDFPLADPAFGAVNHVLRLADDRLVLTAEPLPAMPAELARLFEETPTGVAATAGSGSSTSSTSSRSSRSETPTGGKGA